MSGQHMHMCLCVRGMLKNLMHSRAKNSAFSDDQGRPVSRVKAIEYLMDQLAKGRETLPMHKGCGNPCQNSPTCKGFDYGEMGGCPGYMEGVAA